MNEDTGTDPIVVWADILCPFTHVGLRRLVGRRERSRRRPRFWIRAWPLELVNGATLDPDAVAEKVAVLRGSVAGDLFAGFHPSSFPSTSLPGLSLTVAAYAVGLDVGEAVALELRDRLFEQGQDVSDPEVLDAVGAGHGLDAASVPEDAFEADFVAGRERGVRGSPHFFLRDEDAFCPSLDISHDGDGLHVTFDERRFAAFAERALGPTR